LSGSLNMALRMFKDMEKRTLAGVIVYAVLLCAYLIYDIAGLVQHSAAFVTPLVIIAFVVMIAILFNRERVEKKIDAHMSILKPLLCITLPCIGFFLLERSYNDFILGLSGYYIFINLCIVALLFALFFFAGQQSKTSAIVFMICCFLIGIANYFVVVFKGQPVVPADLFALNTAASVSGGYTYAITDNVVIAFLVLCFTCLLISFLPKAKLNRRAGLANSSVALCCLLVFGFWYSDHDIEEAYGVEVDVWSTKESYKSQGSILCFLKRVQDLSPSPPSDYSPETARELIASYTQGNVAQSDSSYSAMLSEGLELADYSMVLGNTESTLTPSVVVVMNETFSDLTDYEILRDTYSGPTYYQSINDAALKGTAYVSAMAGGTCNSEFELLAGASMGSLGGGVYPYVLYDLEGTQNLPSYFKDLGYETTAIHPAEGTNWRRSLVYSQMGFDQFYDIAAFENADTLRNLTTDKATYDVVLDKLYTSDAPQFIFDVTIQNHSGYQTGLIPEDMQISTSIDGVEYPELNEYISCINQADQDLAYLIDGLNALDRPVVLCFFGDHQPDLADWLAETEYGKDVSDFELDEVQSRYRVPYMIWKNYDKANQPTSVEASEIPQDTVVDFVETATPSTPTTATDTSLNYLGALVVSEAGLPLTDYQRFVLSLRSAMPAINLNGYMDEAGIWHWIGEESAASQVFHDYAIVQYDALFNKEVETIAYARD
jgi:hypothetical protein